MPDPKYKLTDDGITRTKDGKLIAAIVAGEIKPTAPVYYKAIDELHEFMRAASDGVTGDKSEPAFGPLGDKAPDVLAWRRKNLSKAQFEAAYGARFEYKEGGK